ncbi:Transcriptional regulator, contains XRE-family HTH domain [Cohaesibacter sp. ES.047]|uniref:helix-turn-helix domain-containing protein n=1 Tax=Cohaesibacter sp. ES.047 TaxID=1798205 RepID=UPI000BB7F979|nr:XRE family transcriptional regulator [Cohaesibacter sp. ES.047]SNY93078.1 Transcriptional regulator, contains XRE-family HTH domain [Cohaesibacter sp. ES.047]
MDDLSERIAGRLLQMRKQSDWSLDQLAEKSGVSRATLSRLEKGDVSPTAQMLNRICTAYRMPVSRLMMMAEETMTPLISPEQQAVWLDPANGFKRRSISPPSPQLAGELLECSLPPGAHLVYDTPVRPNLEHHLYMHEGGLDIVVDQNRYRLGPGDCLRYLLAQASEFRADPEMGAHYLLVIISQERK